MKEYKVEMRVSGVWISAYDPNIGIVPVAAKTRDDAIYRMNHFVACWQKLEKWILKTRGWNRLPDAFRITCREVTKWYPEVFETKVEYKNAERSKIGGFNEDRNQN